MIKKTILTSTLCLLGLMLLSAGIPDHAGEYGYQFLDISTNPVALALAGRGIHSGNALASFIYQPASAVIQAHRTVGASYTAWLDDTAYNNLYYSYSTRKSHVGLAFRNLDYGRLENRDDNAALIGYYSPLNLDLMGNYALRISPSFYAGANVGVAFEKLASDSSIGVHSDLGITWLPPFNATALSLALRNLGVSSAMNEVRTRFAPRMELDLSKTIRFDEHSGRLELSGIKAVDEAWKAAVNAELDLYSLIQVRLGYKLNYDAEDLSAGLGIRWKSIGVDYGWASFSDRLNDIHSLGLSYSF